MTEIRNRHTEHYSRSRDAPRPSGILKGVNEGKYNSNRTFNNAGSGTSSSSNLESQIRRHSYNPVKDPNQEDEASSTISIITTKRRHSYDEERVPSQEGKMIIPAGHRDPNHSHFQPNHPNDNNRYVNPKQEENMRRNMMIGEAGDQNNENKVDDVNLNGQSSMQIDLTALKARTRGGTSVHSRRFSGSHSVAQSQRSTAHSVRSTAHSVRSTAHSVRSNAHSVRSNAHSVRSSALSVRSSARSYRPPPQTHQRPSTHSLRPSHNRMHSATDGRRHIPPYSNPLDPKLRNSFPSHTKRNGVPNTSVVSNYSSEKSNISITTALLMKVLSPFKSKTGSQDGKSVRSRGFRSRRQRRKSNDSSSSSISSKSDRRYSNGGSIGFNEYSHRMTNDRRTNDRRHSDDSSRQGDRSVSRPNSMGYGHRQSMGNEYRETSHRSQNSHEYSQTSRQMEPRMSEPYSYPEDQRHYGDNGLHSHPNQFPNDRRRSNESHNWQQQPEIDERHGDSRRSSNESNSRSRQSDDGSDKISQQGNEFHESYGDTLEGDDPDRIFLELGPWIEHCRDPVTVKKLASFTKNSYAMGDSDEKYDPMDDVEIFELEEQMLNALPSAEIYKPETEAIKRSTGGPHLIGAVDDMKILCDQFSRFFWSYGDSRGTARKHTNVLIKLEEILASRQFLPTCKSFPKDILQIVQLLPGNNKCCDCGVESGWSWIDGPKGKLLFGSPVYGTVLCQSCAFRHITKGAERQFKVQESVLSFAEGDWSLPDILAMVEGGNDSVIDFIQSNEYHNKKQRRSSMQEQRRRGSLLQTTSSESNAYHQKRRSLDSGVSETDSLGSDFERVYGNKIAGSYRKILRDRTQWVLLKKVLK